MVFPLLGLLGGSAAASMLGGTLSGGGAGLMKGLMSGSGLPGMLMKMFGGDASGKGAPEALLRDVHQMLGQLIEGLDSKKGDGCQGGGASHGGSRDGGRGEGAHNGGGSESGGSHGGGRAGDEGAKPEKKSSEGCGCDDAGGSDGAGETGWDGEDKSPSLDREKAALRLLEQAKEAKDPEQKKELIKMALEMLGEGKEGGGSCGADGNSYDKDIVDQARKMMDGIEDSDLNGCNAGKAMDSVIDMLMEEGGVDGKPAGNDRDGDGWGDRHEGSKPSGGLWHLHDHNTMHR